MAMKPNYRQERSQRDKAKASKKEAKLAAKAAKQRPGSSEQEKAPGPVVDQT